VVGRSCSESGPVTFEGSVGAEVVGFARAERGTREYFLEEGWASASSSCRKAWSSFSAISSAERGLEGASFWVI